MPGNLISFILNAVLSVTLMLGCSIPASGFRYGRRDSLISESRLKSDVTFLANDLCKGRGSGTDGATAACQYIIGRFRKIGLNPLEWSYSQSFRYNDSIILRNVAGIIHSSSFCDRYVLICAHYDHLGTIKGKIYKGADDNASGVAVMLAVADAFTQIRKSGMSIPCNYIFVAFDGKELDMAGSRHFAENMGISPEKIKCVVNIDIIGSDLVPVRKNKEYLIALGEQTLPAQYRGHIGTLCSPHRYDLDLDLSFYGSRDFTRMMLELGDHNSFRKKNIPVMFFTSGFHGHTYKPTDDTGIINFELLRRRALVIYNFADFIGRQ